MGTARRNQEGGGEEEEEEEKLVSRETEAHVLDMFDCVYEDAFFKVGQDDRQFRVKLFYDTCRNNINYFWCLPTISKSRDCALDISGQNVADTTINQCCKWSNAFPIFCVLYWWR